MGRLAGMALVVSLLAPSPGTAAQVAAAVKASTSIESIPSDLTPSLSSVLTSSGYWKAVSTDYINNNCNARNTPSVRTKPAACFYGDLRGSPRGRRKQRQHQGHSGQTAHLAAKVSPWIQN